MNRILLSLYRSDVARRFSRILGGRTRREDLRWFELRLLVLDPDRGAEQAIWVSAIAREDQHT